MATIATKVTKVRRKKEVEQERDVDPMTSTRKKPASKKGEKKKR